MNTMNKGKTVTGGVSRQRGGLEAVTGGTIPFWGQCEVIGGPRSKGIA